MKKHLVVVFALSIILVLAPLLSGHFVASAQINTAPITPASLSPTSTTATVSYITNLNTQVRLVNEQYLKANQSQKSVLAINLRTLLRGRKHEMIDLAKIDPHQFLNQRLSPTIIQRIPSELRINIEQPVSLTGRLEVMHVDDFENPENSRYDYSLVVGRDKYTLYPTQPIPSVSGAVLAVSGSRLDEIVVVETEQAEQLRILTPAPPPDSVGEQKTLVLLIDFLDSGPPPKTPAEIYDLTFNGQFQKFYREQSYNKVRFTGDVKGWYTLPRNNNCIDPPAPESYNETARLILDNNIDLSLYDRLVIGIGALCGGGYSDVGKSNFSVGDKNFNLSIAWVRASESDFSSEWSGGDINHPFSLLVWDFVLDHEMGHSLGVMHANGWDCGENVLQGDCQHREYGNYFDTMGLGYYSLHFNSFYKELLGWILPSETIQINSSGRYTLNPLEVSNTTGKLSKKLAKIQSPLATSTTLYLEYRRGIGFDSKLNDPTLSSNQQGLFVNKIIYSLSENPSSAFPRLLDIRPTEADWYEDIFMSTFNSTTSAFTDIGTGISLGPIYKATDSSITFDVGMTEPQCVRSNPLIEDSRLFQYTAPGGAGQFYIIYNNSDSSSCGGSNFRVVTNIPSTWQPTISPANDVFIFPNAPFGQSVAINFAAPTNAPFGTHSFTVEVINLTTNYKTTRTLNVEVLNSPTISSITPLSGPIGTTITISGTNLSFFPAIYFINPMTGNFFRDGVTSDGNTINFTIPGYLNESECENSCPAPSIPTLPGGYKISVYSNGIQSEPVGFEVTATNTLPTVKVTSPNGGELIPRGTRRSPYWITWQELNFPSPNSYKINLNLKSISGVDRVLFSNLPSGVGYQNWTVPKDLPVGKYKLQVCASEGSDSCAYSDQSDDYFTIIETATVEPIPIVPIIPSPIDPTPIPTPTTTPPSPPPTLLATDPPGGAIDARENQLATATGAGWKSFDLTFSGPVSDLTYDSFTVAGSNSAGAPRARSVQVNIQDPSRATLSITRPIQPGERVTIAHKPSGASVCLGFLPGDVNQDGRFNSTDISGLRSLVDTANGAAKPLWQTDINRDNLFDANDLTRLSELRSVPEAILTLPACPSPIGLSAKQGQLANIFSTLREMLEIWSRLSVSR